MKKGLSVLPQNQNLQTSAETRLLGQRENNDYLKLIKSPRNKEVINEAETLEKRVRLHTVGTQDSSTSFDDWLESVSHYIDKSKFSIFKKLVGSPVPTLALTETIFDELSKIYESSNPAEKFTFVGDSETESAKFTSYFNHNEFFKKDYYNQLKTSPNSFIIVDTKTELGADGRQQPITYFVDISNVIDIEADRDGNIIYIIFYADKDRVIAIDSMNYCLYTKEDNSDFSMVSGYPSAHNLMDDNGKPMTPAFMLYPNFLNANDNIITNTPLTKSLGQLEWALFFSVAKRHLDSYAAFPIYVSLEEECKYQTERGETCENGYVKTYTSDLASGDFTVTPCPSCSANRAIGAGTTITVKAPQEVGDPNNLDAVRVIPAEKESITYVTQEKKRLEEEIYYSILGKTLQPLETFSQSVSQLDMSTESRKAVLIRTKEVVEKVHQKVVYVMCKLIYGDQFINFYKNYGDNYFLTSPEQEAKKYADLKNSGAPESMLHATLSRLVAITYKTSPYTALLQEVYLEVEPHQTKSVEDVQKLYGAGLITRKDVIAKVYFTDFIEVFEADNRALVNTLDVNSGFRKRSVLVAQIKEKLYEYVSTIILELDSDATIVENKVSMATQQMPDLAKPINVDKRKYDEGKEPE